MLPRLVGALLNAYLFKQLEQETNTAAESTSLASLAKDKD